MVVSRPPALPVLQPVGHRLIARGALAAPPLVKD